ncbi:MAG: aminopeptidase P family protein [Deltaproteobacteria bacterium]|nr:aminopeptidase P family protein [Deltaproteobacteria bacterium]
MTSPSERLHHPISTEELERRWALVRAAMEEREIDVLLMQNNNDFMGGYVKYFTDLPATHGYPQTVIFPRKDSMTVIVQTRFGEDQQLPPEGNWLRRGVKRVLGAPYFSSAYYTLAYDAELAAKTLEPYARGTIGLVGRGTLPVSLIDHLRSGRLANSKLVDATDMVDSIKVIKSEGEIAHIRRTAAVQDGAVEAAMKAVAPGKREIEIAAVAEHFVLDHGGEQGLFLCSSHAPGEPVAWGNRHLQNRALRKGDMFTLLVESNGPGGFYTEISRTCVLGRAPREMLDEFTVLLEARKLTLSLLKPGASCKDIWDSYNGFLRKHGKPEEERLYCHGQGYDLVERPLVRFDEPMPIRKNMNLTCHPTYLTGLAFNTICDNFLIGEQGVVERLHKYPEKIVELG